MSKLNVHNIREAARKYVSGYMVANTPLINYVYNPAGFVYGVVVALGKEHVGWSMVSPAHDTFPRWLRPHQLPAIQMLTERARRENKFFDITMTEAYINWVANRGFINVPKFDRVIGIIKAIECAEKNQVKVIGDSISFEGKVPTNPMMKYAISNMIDRSRKVRRFMV